mgnify:CR=1 FL=1
MMGAVAGAYSVTNTLPSNQNFGVYNSQIPSDVIFPGAIFPAGNFVNLTLTLGTRVIEVYLDGILQVPVGSKVFPYNRGMSYEHTMLSPSTDPGGPITSVTTVQAMQGGTTRTNTLSATTDSTAPEGF